MVKSGGEQSVLCKAVLCKGGEISMDLGSRFGCARYI